MSAMHHSERVEPTMPTFSPRSTPWSINQLAKAPARLPKIRQLVPFHRPIDFSR